MGEMSRYRGSGHPGEPVDRNPGADRRIPGGDRREGWRLRVTAAVWNVAWEVSRRLPEAAAHALAAVLARVAHRFADGPRRQLTRNLARVVEPDQLDRMVREGFRSYARYWVEAFRAADLDPDDLDRRTTTNGFEHLDAVLDEGKGAVILLAHHGSWDVCAQWGETHGYHLAVVAEVVRPRALFEKFVRLREAVGLEVVPLRRGQDLVGRLEQVLAANHLVGLLSERDLTGRGPVVRLFGEEARLPRGPVVLSQRTHAPIVPATMLQRPGRRWHIEVMPPIRAVDLDFDAAARGVAAALEEIIRLDPAQWHALQPVWLADVPPRRRGSWTPPAERADGGSREDAAR
ncbi:MAG TPA: phosphatidylinositol mannoside acyltransferase [Egibacteraceae bacterium]|nr:phosphatidylinositol mannoside acyltransferase [Egibacteraceae bacterium]